MDNLRRDHKEMKECIRCFDVSICEKANKSGLIAMESRMFEQFILKDDYENLKLGLKKAEVERNKEAEKTKQDFVEF